MQHTFSANSSGRECISVTILDNTHIEGQEVFAVQLITDGTVHSTALVTLVDDDGKT